MRRAPPPPPSKQRRRFTKDGFNLDLAYITPRIIALAGPAQPGAPSGPRDALADVARFLQQRHAGCFRLYNLCAEADRAYDAAAVGGAVEAVPCEEGEAPALAAILSFCASAAAWLQAEAANVVAVHCKAGTGRSGLMCASLLLHLGEHSNAAGALAAFAAARTRDGKAVTLPSQRRYVSYYEQLRATGAPATPSAQCVEVRAKLPSTAPAPTLRLWQRAPCGALAALPWCDGIRAARAGGDVVYSLPASSPALDGDVKLTLSDKAGAVLCYAWVNTRHLPRGGRLALSRAEVDRPSAALPDDFSLRVRFAVAPPTPPPPPPRAASPKAPAMPKAPASPRAAASPAAKAAPARSVSTPPKLAAATLPRQAAQPPPPPDAVQEEPAVPSAADTPQATPVTSSAAGAPPASALADEAAAQQSKPAQPPVMDAACAAAPPAPPGAAAADAEVTAPRPVAAEPPEAARALQQLQRDLEDVRREAAAEAAARRALDGELQRLCASLAATPPPPAAAPPGEVGAALNDAARHIRALAAALAAEQRANAQLRAQLAATAAVQ